MLLGVGYEGHGLMLMLVVGLGVDVGCLVGYYHPGQSHYRGIHRCHDVTVKVISYHHGHGIMYS